MFYLIDSIISHDFFCGVFFPYLLIDSVVSVMGDTKYFDFCLCLGRANEKKNSRILCGILWNLGQCLNLIGWQISRFFDIPNMEKFECFNAYCKLLFVHLGTWYIINELLIEIDISRFSSEWPNKCRKLEHPKMRIIRWITVGWTTRLIQ